MARCLAAALLIGTVPGAFGQGGGTWATRAPMPSARTEVAVVEAGGKIYVIGGFGQSGDLVEEYDPSSDRWRRRASLPRPLHHVGAAAIAGRIYVIGGYDPGWTPADTVFEYTPSSDQWRAPGPPPPP
ncbi:MAG: galactose oxidase, partial [Deltaproteobacteria bacterium]|nr:galactose oxidase [Deltaproteobacteria bacterium]